MDDAAAWRKSVEDERAGRGAFYLGKDTPLSIESRERFHGLQWFALDARFRVRSAKLRRHEAPIAGRVGATGLDAVAMLEVGELRFELLGKSVRLFAYSPTPGASDEDYILVPFRDETSGKETYGAGRYLDVEPDARDEYELDFNRAYHPYCAHDDAWACTLPPPENKLPLRVEAGERMR